MPAFLKIPDEQYYFYQLIFLIPMFLITWLLAGGIAYVISKALGGNGSYNTIVGGFGIAAITWNMHRGRRQRLFRAHSGLHSKTYCGRRVGDPSLSIKN